MAANPAEYALAALGSCQAITYRVWAAQLGIKLDKVDVSIDGEIDLRGFWVSTTRSGLASMRFASGST